MGTVSLLFLGRLSDAAGSDPVTVERGDAATVGALGLLVPLLAAALADETVRVAVNGTLGGRELALADGDEVALLPPVSGG